MSSCTIDKKANRIIWMDLEMTGLDIDRDHIMELACLVTDSDLNVVATGPDIVIHQPDHILNSMNEWCKAHHVNKRRKLAKDVQRAQRDKDLGLAAYFETKAENVGLDSKKIELENRKLELNCNKLELENAKLELENVKLEVEIRQLQQNMNC
ncbi:unnamed protein product [Leptidea sinapis]|uniref:Exonuclease domain-containing protein n=1 Tax=Leptidea sinapis TaxID=189913 RepID=A0A5E4QFB8_9NEOP|nr:unnamed protein product [Leptidea sinapis]